MVPPVSADVHPIDNNDVTVCYTVTVTVTAMQCNAMQLDGERDDDLPLKCPVLCGTNNNPAPVTSATSTSGTEELDGGDSYGCVPVAAYAGDETIVQLCTSMETACDTQAIFCIYLPPPSTTSTVTTVTTVTTVAAVKTGCVRAEK